MDLHAFLINQIEPLNLRKVTICLFVFCLIFSYSKANRQVQLPKIPYEIEFADVVFQLNDATRFLLREEVTKLDNDEELKQKQLEFLTLFLPEVTPVLKESAVPDDFRYLVIYNKYQKNTAESGLLEKGVFWCMTKDFAADQDLRVNSQIDERKNFFLATNGAAIGFRRNNVLYNSWGTTLFAQLASRDVINLLGVNRNWNGKKYLVIDSPAFSSLIQFLAFKLVMENEMPTFRPKEEKVVYQYPYGSQKTLNVIAADLRVEPLELKKWNLWLKDDRIQKEFVPVLVIVPAARYNDVRILAEISSNTDFPKEEMGFPVLTEEPSLAEGRGGQFYRINGKRGIKADLCDSYVDLAFKAKVSDKSFLDYNDMQETDVVTIGQIYYLEDKDSKGPIDKHISRESENLWDISMLYGIKLQDLLKYNRLETTQIFQRGRVVYLKDKRGKNEPVEYLKINEKKIAEEALENDPILETRTAFDWPNPEVIKEEVLAETKTPKEEVKLILKKVVEPEKIISEPQIAKEELVVLVKEEEEVQRRELVAKPVENKSYSTNLKNKVLGVEDSEEVPSAFVIHTVKKGETLYRISVNYRVTVNQLYKLNSLHTNIIEIGDRIKVKPI